MSLVSLPVMEYSDLHSRRSLTYVHISYLCITVRKGARFPEGRFKCVAPWGFVIQQEQDMVSVAMFGAQRLASAGRGLAFPQWHEVLSKCNSLSFNKGSNEDP